MPKTSSSYFSYNLTRPYPFKWFTPAVILGGIVVTVLISILNVGTTGYALVAVSSNNPNTTERQETWFGRSLGSVLGSMQPSCDSTTIPLDTVIYTNNTALRYTLRKVSMRKDESRVQQGSLVYHNNPLQNCTITNMTFYFEGLQRPADSIYFQQQGVLASTFVDCIVETEQGVVDISLATQYQFVQDDYVAGSKFTGFQGRNAQSQASLYWGESMLVLFWLNLSDNWWNEYSSYKAFFSLARSAELPSQPEEVKSLDFFNLIFCTFMPFYNDSHLYEFDFLPGSSLAVLASGDSGVWNSVDNLAKSLYFTILTDLGQTSTNSNILTDPELLSYFTKDFDDIIKASKTPVWDGSSFGESWGEDGDGLATQQYSPETSQSGSLVAKPSTLASNYLCQVPKLRPTGSLITTVLIADLVLLRTIWQMFRIITDWFLQRKYPEVNCCAGCVRIKQVLENNSEDPIELKSVLTLTNDSQVINHNMAEHEEAWHSMLRTSR